MAKLIDVLRDDERQILKIYGISQDKEIKDLTVQELSDMGLSLMKTELEERGNKLTIDSAIIPAKAIRILIKRCMSVNLPVF
jgi:hypothetical protein